MYQKMISLEDNGLARIRSSWEVELGVDLGEYWEGALMRVNSSSSCARLALIQFKVLHRAHYSKAKIGRASCRERVCLYV